MMLVCTLVTSHTPHGGARACCSYCGLSLGGDIVCSVWEARECAGPSVDRTLFIPRPHPQLPQPPQPPVRVGDGKVVLGRPAPSSACHRSDPTGVLRVHQKAAGSSSVWIPCGLSVAPNYCGFPSRLAPCSFRGRTRSHRSLCSSLVRSWLGRGEPVYREGRAHRVISDAVTPHHWIPRMGS
jgi:hypothetical protein